MELERAVGLRPDGGVCLPERRTAIRSILLKLAAMGVRVPADSGDEDVLHLAGDLFARYREQTRLLSEHLCPADRRIQHYIDGLLRAAAVSEPVRLPGETLILDHYGLARELSLPIDADAWHNELVSSYRLDNGVLHNPAKDRRTTQGVFHVAEGGLPIPADKMRVPLGAYVRLLREALRPPAELMALPFSANWPEPVRTMVSLLLRPLVCPAVPKVSPEKRMEVRFFVPGGLVSNLDFLESIFGNAGDPYLPANDAALDVDGWTGHSGCIVLAPHLTRLRKKDLGLPHVSRASDAEQAAGMCWSDESELYNDGRAFKITSRGAGGVMVTILADNYFGYCKKEVKTQISYSANLFGLAEEEHAGGTLAFATFNLGERFVPDLVKIVSANQRFTEVRALLGDRAKLHHSGYATDVIYPEIHYMPEDMEIDVHRQDITWMSQGQQQHLKLLPGRIYIHPSGYKVRMARHPSAPSWRLIGTVPEGAFCHKPCTVSGGGKSEISKSLVDAVLPGSFYVHSFEDDMALVQAIVDRDYDDARLTELRAGDGRGLTRPILSPDRSLGSVIKLLTPNATEFTAEYNAWLESIPNHVRALVFVVKRFYQPEWGDDWRRHFGVDIINGAPGHELKYDGRRLVASYLRVGREENGAWRTYKLRQDFMSADKVQMEDDITASVVVQARRLIGLPGEYDGHPSLKLAQNCEFRLFQRPDDAIHPGLDRQTEADMAGQGLFCSNFQPLTRDDLQRIFEDVAVHDAFTQPMREHVAGNAERTGDGYSICSAEPRLIGGKPSKNPRYLQVRPDIARPRDRYVAEMGARLSRRLPLHAPVLFPVISVLSGRRNNRPEEGIRPLCVYGPIHYQELPELFMDYVCSLTGTSPSTTGAGSEGALTKGPFNALPATTDLNNALVSMLLTGYGGFSSAAGFIGPRFRVDHDISLLIPEIWCRLFPHERDPKRLIEAGHLEKLEDYEFAGKTVLASRLGYRITAKFVHTFFGRVFDNPTTVLTEEILKPEIQDPAVFADGVNNIVEAQQSVAEAYFADGTINDLCPPLTALLHIMAYGSYEGKDAKHPEIRALFTREALLGSDWYRERLAIKQQREVALWERHTGSLSEFLARAGHQEEAERLGIPGRLEHARAELERVSAPEYRRSLVGTIGADPIHRPLHGSWDGGPDSPAKARRVAHPEGAVEAELASGASATSGSSQR
jgi:phosphoenolpyruvate carboxykinase (diphosphate)